MKARLIMLFLFLIVGGLPAIATAQEAPTPPGSALLDGWVGTWSSSGNVMGMAQSGSISWEWALGGWFLHASAEDTYTMEDGTQMTTQSGGFLKPMGDGTYEGHWAQSDGQHYAMSGSESDGNMVLEWTDANGTHRWTVSQEGDTVTATIQSQDESGAWVEGGMVAYTRQAAAE